MKAEYLIINHQRGNHSPEQVYYHGKTHFEGTKTECNAELVRMRKYLRTQWRQTSTNDTQKDFVRYQMGDIFFIKKKDGQISWA
jgi:hypothetical protein